MSEDPDRLDYFLWRMPEVGEKIALIRLPSGHLMIAGRSAIAEGRHQVHAVSAVTGDRLEVQDYGGIARVAGRHRAVWVQTSPLCDVVLPAGKAGGVVLGRYGRQAATLAAARLRRLGAKVVPVIE